MPKIHLQLTVDGAQTKHELELTQGTKMVVGRAGGLLRVEHRSVSRAHFYFEFDGESLKIADNQSTNGTALNGKAIGAAEVHEGDTVKFGDCKLHILAISGIESTSPGVSASRGRQESSKPPSPRHRSRTAPDSGRLAVSKLLATPRTAINFYKAAIEQPQTFHESLSYDCSIEHSAVIIAITGALSVLLMPSSALFPTWTMSFAAYAAVAGVFFTALFSALLHMVRGFLRMRGDFTSYMSFGAALAALNFPCFVLSGFLPIVGGLIPLCFFCWGAYGFYRTYRPDLGRSLVVGGVLLLPCVVLSIASTLLLLKGNALTSSIQAMNYLGAASRAAEMAAANSRTPTPTTIQTPTQRKSTRQTCADLEASLSLGLASMPKGEKRAFFERIVSDYATSKARDADSYDRVMASVANLEDAEGAKAAIQNMHELNECAFRFATKSLKDLE